MLKAKIGNLTAGAEAKIQLTYVTELKMEAGEICFYLPTTIAPSFSLYCDKSREADQQESFNYTLFVLLLHFLHDTKFSS